jgi:hypothetical protein
VIQSIKSSSISLLNNAAEKFPNTSRSVTKKANTLSRKVLFLIFKKRGEPYIKRGSIYVSCEPRVN